MKIFYTILASILTSLMVLVGGVFYFLNFVSFGDLDLLTLNKPLNVGTTLTTLNSSDTMSDFPTLYNANNTLLNSGKIEVSSSSIAAITTLSNLTSVGTIVTGVWNGTLINVNKGGTGLATLPQWQVLLGSSTNAVSYVSGLGSDGQFLTSQGAGLPPVWETSAINQAANYTWTGQHAFNATTTQSGVVGGLTPVGSITAYASSSPPTGWLSANGAAVSRSTYYQLFSIIGTTYGVGDNSTTFNLPNLLGRQILMASSTANMAQSGGESNHTMTIQELVSHNHSITSKGSVIGTGLYAGQGADQSSVDTTSTGSTVPFNVLDPYLTAWYIIKY